MRTTRNLPILVVEDSDEDFETVQEASRKAGISNELRRARTGDICLQILCADGGEQLHPSLVLMDLNTPGLDGRDALKIIKSDPRLRTLPVIILTTSSNPRDLDYCYETGANAYHLKPVEYEDHLRALSQIFDYWLGSVVLPGSEEILTI